MEAHHSFFANPRSWVAIAFVIFFVLFGRKLWAALAAVLDKHAATIRADLDEAARLRKEGETLLADAKTRREAAIIEAKALLESAHAEARRVAEQAGIEAEAAGHRREKMALDRIAAAEKGGGDGCAPGRGGHCRTGGGAGHRRDPDGRGGCAADRPCHRRAALRLGARPGCLATRLGALRR